MKKAQKLFALILALALLASLSATALAANPCFTAEQEAAELHAWGLLQGVSEKETAFALYRAATRAEALVMLIRVLDKEGEVLAGTHSHPFTDVPDWAAAYVGYAYENGLTKGVSDTLFGTQDIVEANMYLTFMLRALGYDDSSGDFDWRNPFSIARNIGLTDNPVSLDEFMRRDLVLVSYNALYCPMLGGSMTLAETLDIDVGTRPVAALDTEWQVLAAYFGVSVFQVTAMIDAINTLLAGDGYAESYRLTGIQARIDSGELAAFRQNAADGTAGFYDFVESETTRVYREATGAQDTRKG